MTFIKLYNRGMISRNSEKLLQNKIGKSGQSRMNQSAELFIGTYLCFNYAAPPDSLYYTYSDENQYTKRRERDIKSILSSLNSARGVETKIRTNRIL